MPPQNYGLTPTEFRTLKAMKTPAGIQKFIDSLPYHHADTAWSPRKVLRERTGHCLEGALLAAAALRVLGHKALVMDLEGIRDSDHVIALYKHHGYWGAIAKSNFAGLRFRAPVYKTTRELALSYFENYYNLRGERTLRGYSMILDLKKFDKQEWMTSEKSVWSVPELLVTCRHHKLFPERVARDLPRLDPRSFAAGLQGHSKKH